MHNPSNRRAFTLFEVLLAGSIAAVVCVALTAFVSAQMRTMAFSGTITLGPDFVVPAAPNGTVAVMARSLSSELRRDTADAVAVLAFPGAIKTSSTAGASGRLPSLATAPASVFASPISMRNYLVGRDGIEMESSEGMTIFCMGPNQILISTTRVFTSVYVGQGSVLYRYYSVSREGPENGMWTRMQFYHFAEPAATPQRFTLPNAVEQTLGDGVPLARGVVVVSLPDPSRDAVEANRVSLPAPASTIQNALPFP